MSITVIGIGPEAYKEIHNMTKMAGDKRKVLLYEGYNELSRHLDDVLEAVCGKLEMCNIPWNFLILNSKWHLLT